ncbi:uncharacterized protein PHACADRAFT_204758 [Phanerochaete carnosa HHB-10118-sp]|uniref:Uncharacterized protein n=1 Tax=Phanerochaete carnosa (strain HHB-10118-sp) TaxID=650164 RepID=K5VEY7_PHACS|nr:uncharacterized protein PHACADRAFT_204758 [Phanerochaete carnosa HHB-10118-sp]EKM61591.1 hypothetical protein PHACADRAFT_204758 [Phanerochaete carnosa HHB-10118-sp]
MVPSGTRDLLYIEIHAIDSDVVCLSVNATTTSTGVVTVANLTTSKNAIKEVSGSTLCQQVAEWLVADYIFTDATALFVDLDKVVFDGEVLTAVITDNIV